MITLAIALADKWQPKPMGLPGGLYLAAVIADATWLTTLAASLAS